MDAKILSLYTTGVIVAPFDRERHVSLIFPADKESGIIVPTLFGSLGEPIYIPHLPPSMVEGKRVILDGNSVKVGDDVIPVMTVDVGDNMYNVVLNTLSLYETLAREWRKYPRARLSRAKIALKSLQEELSLFRDKPRFLRYIPNQKRMVIVSLKRLGEYRFPVFIVF